MDPLIVSIASTTRRVRNIMPGISGAQHREWDPYSCVTLVRNYLSGQLVYYETSWSRFQPAHLFSRTRRSTPLARVAGNASWSEQFAGRNEVSEAADTANGRQCVHHDTYQPVLFYRHCCEPEKP